MPPYYSREYSHNYSNVSVSVKVAPWTDVAPQGQQQQRESHATSSVRYRVVAMIQTDVSSRAETSRHPYTVVQVERRKDRKGSYSSYSSTILIGNLVDEEHEHALFFTGNTCPHQGLWCSNCWAEDMVYTSNPKGGVLIPPSMFGRYFSRLRALEPCWNCSRSFVPFLSEHISVPAPTYVFSTIRNKGLQSAVERELLPFGITAFEHVRPYTITAPTEFSMEIVSCAMAPRRVSRLLDMYGFEGLEELF